MDLKGIKEAASLSNLRKKILFCQDLKPKNFDQKLRFFFNTI